MSRERSPPPSLDFIMKKLKRSSLWKNEVQPMKQALSLHPWTIILRLPYHVGSTLCIKSWILLCHVNLIMGFNQQLRAMWHSHLTNELMEVKVIHLSLASIPHLAFMLASRVLLGSSFSCPTLIFTWYFHRSYDLNYIIDWIISFAWMKPRYKEGGIVG